MFKLGHREAVDVPVDGAPAKVRESSRVSGYRMRVGRDFSGVPVVADVTSRCRLRDAPENLDDLKRAKSGASETGGRYWVRTSPPPSG